MTKILPDKKEGTQTIEFHIDELKDRNPYVRQIGAKILGEIGDARAVEPLINVLKDDTPGTQEIAAEALAKIGKPAVEPLTHLLMDRGPFIREKTAESLSKIGDAGAAGPLIDALECKVHSTREIIIKALLKVGDPKDAAPFINALKNKSFDTRKIVVEVLNKIGWKPSNNQESALYLAARQEWNKLFTFGKNAVEILIDALEDERSEVRRNAARVLGKIGDTMAVGPLIRVLKEDKGPLIRRKAAMALCKIGDAGAIEPLIFFMKGQSLYVKWKVIKALEKIGDPKAIGPLFSYMKGKSIFTRRKVIDVLSKISAGTNGPVVKALKDNDHHTRGRAVKVLDNIGWNPSNNNELALYLIAKKKWKKLPTIGKDAVKSLIDVLDDNAQSVRNKVVKVLGEIGTSQAVEPLIQRLYYESSPVYSTIIRALTKIIDAGKVEPFITALKNKDVNFRLKTAEALDHIGWLSSTNKELAFYLAARQRWNKLPELGTEAVEPLVNLIKDNIPGVRENVVEALGKIGNSSAVESLIDALKDKYLNVRKKAAEALGKIGDPRAIQPLKDALTDTDTGVRSEAVEALGNMGTGVVEFLITLLEEKIPGVRENAAKALGKIGDTGAVEPLIRALKDVYEEVQVEAAAALGKIGDKRAVEPLFDKITDRNPVWEKVVLALGKIGDTRAVGPLIFLGWRSKEAENVLNNIRGKIPFEDLNFFCEKCYCRAVEHKPEPLTSYFKHMYIRYYACRMCHSNSYLSKGIEKVVLLLDHGFEETAVRTGPNLIVNWFKREGLVDYDEIRIKDADNYDVEKLVMELRNDMDDQRRKRLPDIPVYLSPHLRLSQAKMNLLKDNFRLKRERYDY